MKLKMIVLMFCLCFSALSTAQSLTGVLLGVSKTPYEAFNISVDFTAAAGAHGITLVSVTSTNARNGTDSTNTIVATSPVPAVVGSTDVVVYRVQNGNKGEVHIVSTKVRDNVTGELYEGRVQITLE